MKKVMYSKVMLKKDGAVYIFFGWTPSYLKEDKLLEKAFDEGFKFIAAEEDEPEGF